MTATVHYLHGRAGSAPGSRPLDSRPTAVNPAPEAGTPARVPAARPSDAWQEVRCGWCRMLLAMERVVPEQDATCSHGICRRCREVHFPRRVS